MIIKLRPSLTGNTKRRFDQFANRIIRCQISIEKQNLRQKIVAILERETEAVQSSNSLVEQPYRYMACIRVLSDLVMLRWFLVRSETGLELHSKSSGTVTREEVRDELLYRVTQQLAGKNTRLFIERLENPARNSKRKSVRMLIENGARLKERLRKGRDYRRTQDTRLNSLRDSIKPYLQLVEPNLTDEYTGLALSDVWRYFRHGWSIPKTSIPGRNLTYLIRDGASQTHAVIGIAQLSNCAVQVVERDRSIGWNIQGLIDALRFSMNETSEEEEHSSKKRLFVFNGFQSLSNSVPIGSEMNERKRAILENMYAWLEDSIQVGINGIEAHGLITPEALKAPTAHDVEELRILSKAFAKRRQEALIGKARNTQTCDPNSPWLPPPVNEDVLNLDRRNITDENSNVARQMLILKKRAMELSRLLDAIRVLGENRIGLTDPAIVFETIKLPPVKVAINTALNTIKGRSIGTNILEITTCGAVPPYNDLLGGKLVSLLMLSPQVSADYHRKYNDRPTIIRSQMRNKTVLPDNTLVWVGTTSLYANRSSQYNRLRLPAGVISEDQEEIRYSFVGNTSGYGTLQFSDSTIRALDECMARENGFRDFNSAFGEGASPRLRKLRAGLNLIGIKSELAMMHHQGRRIYIAPLFSRAGAYLCGFSVSPIPMYVKAPECYLDATERITDYWRRRWLSRRIRNPRVWNALDKKKPKLLTETHLIPTDHESKAV